MHWKSSNVTLESDFEWTADVGPSVRTTLNREVLQIEGNRHAGLIPDHDTVSLHRGRDDERRALQPAGAEVDGRLDPEDGFLRDHPVAAQSPGRRMR